MDLVRAVLECRDGEFLAHLHRRGPGLAPKKKKGQAEGPGGADSVLPHTAAATAAPCAATADGATEDAERGRRSVLGWLASRSSAGQGGAGNDSGTAGEHAVTPPRAGSSCGTSGAAGTAVSTPPVPPVPPPVPLCPTLIHAFKLGGFKLPNAWSKAVHRCKQHIKKMHATAAYKAFLAGYDQFVR